MMNTEAMETKYIQLESRFLILENTLMILLSKRHFYQYGRDWYENSINDKYRLFRMYILLSAYSQDCAYVDETNDYIDEIYGKGYSKYPGFQFNSHLFSIVNRLMRDYIPLIGEKYSYHL